MADKPKAGARSGRQLGNRTSRPHSTRGWVADRESNYGDTSCPDGCTGADNPGGYHVGRSRGHN